MNDKTVTPNKGVTVCHFLPSRLRINIQENKFGLHLKLPGYVMMYSESLPDLQINDFMYNRINNWAYRIFIKGAKHNDFTDLRLSNPELSKAMGELGTIKPERILKVVNSYLVAFFDKHLKDIDSLLIKGPNEDFPEVDFQVRKVDIVVYYSGLRFKKMD